MPRHQLPDDIEKTDVTGLETDNNSQQSFLQRSNFYPAPPGGSAGQGDNSLSMESKHRDKHLRSLLAEQQHAMMTSNSGGGILSETSSNSNGESDFWVVFFF